MGDHAGSPGVGSAGGPLSDDDVRSLSRLLARFAELDLDQFELWKLHKPGYGDAYIYFALERLPGERARRPTRESGRRRRSWPKAE